MPVAQGDFEWENKLENGIWTYSTDMIHNELQSCYKSLKADVQAKADLTAKTDAMINCCMI